MKDNSDTIECENCHDEIRHDEYLFFVFQGFNCHGEPMGLSNSDDIVVCTDCAPDEIIPEGWESDNSNKQEPAAWMFTIESDHPDVGPFERVRPIHPRETYGKVDGLTVTKVQPLYTNDE